MSVGVSSSRPCEKNQNTSRVLSTLRDVFTVHTHSLHVDIRTSQFTAVTTRPHEVLLS